MRIPLPQSTVGDEDLTPLVKESKPRWDRDREIEDQESTASLLPLPFPFLRKLVCSLWTSEGETAGEEPGLDHGCRAKLHPPPPLQGDLAVKLNVSHGVRMELPTCRPGSYTSLPAQLPLLGPGGLAGMEPIPRAATY